MRRTKAFSAVRTEDQIVRACLHAIMCYLSYSISALAVLLLPSLTLSAPYSEYILAPSQRTLTPASVHFANGSVTNPSALTTDGSGVTVFNSFSGVTYDYGKNIGGLVSFSVSSVNGSGNYIGISFSESSLWISPDGSDATQNVGIDRTLWFPVPTAGNYTVDNSHQRGGFRYLNVYHHSSSGSVSLSSLTTYFTAMPHYAEDELQDYTGYFHSNDEQLNRVWYAAAYTDQLCTIPSTSGNSLVDLEASNPDIPTYWWSNSTLTNGTSALVDGAKRDKLIWPGDFSISLPGGTCSDKRNPSTCTAPFLPAIVSRHTSTTALFVTENGARLFYFVSLGFRRVCGTGRDRWIQKSSRVL